MTAARYSYPASRTLCTGLRTSPMAPNTEAGTALTEGTVEEGDTGITVLMQGTDTGIGAHGVTSIATLIGTEVEAERGSTGEGRRRRRTEEGGAE